MADITDSRPRIIEARLLFWGGRALFFCTLSTRDHSPTDCETQLWIHSPQLCDPSPEQSSDNHNRQHLPKYQGSGGNQLDDFGAKQRKRPFRAGISGKVVSTGFCSSDT